MQSSLFDSNINSGTYDCQNTSTYETATKSSHENPEQARGVQKNPVLVMPAQNLVWIASQ